MDLLWVAFFPVINMKSSNQVMSVIEINQLENKGYGHFNK